MKDSHDLTLTSLLTGTKQAGIKKLKCVTKTNQNEKKTEKSCRTIGTKAVMNELFWA